MPTPLKVVFGGNVVIAAVQPTDPTPPEDQTITFRDLEELVDNTDPMNPVVTRPQSIGLRLTNAASINEVVIPVVGLNDMLVKARAAYDTFLADGTGDVDTFLEVADEEDDFQAGYTEGVLGSRPEGVDIRTPDDRQVFEATLFQALIIFLRQNGKVSPDLLIAPDLIDQTP